MWKNIKCQSCGTQNKRMFFMMPPRHANDDYYIDCKDNEILKRAEKR